MFKSISLNSLAFVSFSGDLRLSRTATRSDDAPRSRDDRNSSIREILRLKSLDVSDLFEPFFLPRFGDKIVESNRSLEISAHTPLPSSRERCCRDAILTSRAYNGSVEHVAPTALVPRDDSSLERSHKRFSRLRLRELFDDSSSFLPAIFNLVISLAFSFASRSSSSSSDNVVVAATRNARLGVSCVARQSGSFFEPTLEKIKPRDVGDDDRCPSFLGVDLFGVFLEASSSDVRYAVWHSSSRRPNLRKRFVLSRRSRTNRSTRGFDLRTLVVARRECACSISFLTIAT